ncbi:trypsin-like serine peptidase [Micromonospora sp. NPDC001898]|uniref:trypsin-like serine peptidase n=1 Tax=Micromonospora sp. NPDC001898 TaxID=3364221 RepID=UPI0036AA1E83
MSTTLAVAASMAMAAPSTAALTPPGIDALLSVDGAVGHVSEFSPEVARSIKGTGVAAKERALASYWTPERMRSARPAGKTISATTVGDLTAPSRASRPRGEPFTVPPAEPTVAQAPIGPAAGPATSSTATGMTISSSQPFYPIGHPVARTSGKVFFTMRGEDYVCSAGVVNASGKSLVWTAGHCVTELDENGKRRWAVNFTFVPNYQNGTAPYGHWPALITYADGNWAMHNDWKDDVGAVLMPRNSLGQRIQDVVGGMGITFGQPIQYAWAFGYPAGPPFNGQTLWRANSLAHDAGASIIYMENDMTSGSSGGYWLTQFNGSTGLINGHNSFVLDTVPGRMFSPYYGLATQNFYLSVESLTV